MSRTGFACGRVCLVGLTLAAGLLVGGCSSDRSYRSQADTTNVVRRPAYGSDDTKTLYLGGYAGANYDYGARPGR